MKVELYKNGEMQLILTPEDKAEIAFLEQMHERSQINRPVRIRKEGQGFIVVVEK
jgi:hypothetical protein